MKQNRIEYIDAARGTAMLFVCLSHFVFIYFYKAGQIKSLEIYEIIAKISMVATPTFLMISGLMLGYLYRMNTSNFKRIKSMLIDRGLFLIIIGHMLINISYIPSSGGIKNSFQYIFVTDLIGVSIIVGSLLIEKIKLSQRLILALSIYSINWLAIFLIHPDNLFLKGIKDAIFGPWRSNVFHYNFPLLPWLCFYFVHTCLGEQIAIYHLKGEDENIEKKILKTAIYYLLIAITIKLIYKTMLITGFIPRNEVLIALQSPFQKLPPSPVYLLFYGGLGLFILYFLLKFKEKSFIIKYYSKSVSILGRTSLFVFVFQYYIYFVLLYYIDIKNIFLSPVIFLITLIIIHRISTIWDNHNFNKFISFKRLRFKY